MRRLVCLLLCVLLLTACGTGGTESSASASGSSAAASASSSSSEGGQEPAANTPFTLAAAPSYSFHPVLAESTINLTLAPLMYEGLFTLDSTFQAQPLLCQNYVVSSDGLTWTFTLQTGITFSDGTPLTGEVAAQALQTARDPASRYAARLSSVSSIQGTGNQVVITLSQPNGVLPQLLDIPISLGTGDRPLGTGPYVLTDQNGTLSLTARSDWRLGVENLPVQEITLSSTARTDELMPAFNAGEITLMDVDLTGNSALGSSGRYQVWDYNTTSMLYLGFNAQQGLCRDAAVRKAIAQAIDRDDVADSIFARHAKAAALPVHPDSPWYDGELAAELAYDPSVLADLSLDGRPLTLVVNIEDTAKSAAATYIAQQLEAAGLVVTVDRLPWAEYQEAVASRDFDLYLGEIYLTPDFDLSPLLGLGGSLNYGGWTSNVIGSLLSTFRNAQGEARVTAAAALYRHLCQQVPIAPICFRSGTVLTQYGRVDGLSPVYGNIFSQLDHWTIQG